MLTPASSKEMEGKVSCKPCKSCKLEWDGSLIPTSFAMNGNNGKENKPSMEDATLAHECGTLTSTPSEGMEEEASVVELGP